jgi:alpha-mannosidase
MLEQPPALSDSLYTPVIAYRGKPMSAGLSKLDAGTGVIPSWAKPLDSRRWVLRAHETLGQGGDVRIVANSRTIRLLDLRDKPARTIKSGQYPYDPYQLLSFEVRQ